MPRTARFLLPGLPLHVIQRGHNRSPCFIRDLNYELYLALLKEFSAHHGCDVHGYVLMTNHIHLLLTPRDLESVSGLMRSVNQRYVQHVNRTTRHAGSLWQGRFKSSIVDTDGYLLTCQR